MFRLFSLKYFGKGQPCCWHRPPARHPAAVWIFWKPGNPDFWKSGNLDFWDLEIQKFGTWKSRNWGSKKWKKSKFSKSKSVLPKMLARSELVGKKSSRPYLGPSEAIFSMDRKNAKNCIFCLFFLGGPLLLSTRGGVYFCCRTGHQGGYNCGICSS